MRIAVVGILLLMGLTGCAASVESASTSDPTTPPKVSPTPTPAPDNVPVAVPIDDYATQIDFRGSGVDFDSTDGNIHCGIWDSYESYSQDSTTPTLVPYAGCRPADATYQTDPSADPTGNVGCRGGEMKGDGSPEPVCGSGQEFVGEAPMERPVGAILPGQSISFAGFTCVAPNDGTIECSRDADGAGFSIGRDAYRYFSGP